MPDEIKIFYLAAKINSSIALIPIKSLLEKICKDKGTKKKKLISMFSKLFNKGILPEHLNNCSYFIRKLGNTGAHEEDEVSK